MDRRQFNQGNAYLRKYSAVGQHAMVLARRRLPRWKRALTGFRIAAWRWDTLKQFRELSPAAQETIYYSAYKAALADLKGDESI